MGSASHVSNRSFHCRDGYATPRYCDSPRTILVHSLLTIVKQWLALAKSRAAYAHHKPAFSCCTSGSQSTIPRSFLAAASTPPVSLRRKDHPSFSRGHLRSVLRATTSEITTQPLARRAAPDLNEFLTLITRSALARSLALCNACPPACRLVLAPCAHTRCSHSPCCCCSLASFLQVRASTRARKSERERERPSESVRERK